MGKLRNQGIDMDVREPGIQPQSGCADLVEQPDFWVDWLARNGTRWTAAAEADGIKRMTLGRMRQVKTGKRD